VTGSLKTIESVKEKCGITIIFFLNVRYKNYIDLNITSKISTAN
jgi:hypothetical protein